ncbi:MAG: acyl-CoA thioesterase [Bacillota bacterium]
MTCGDPWVVNWEVIAGRNYTCLPARFPLNLDLPPGSDITCLFRSLRTGTTAFQHVTSLRVRYSETDQMGTFYNSRALEWFECGRTELLRAAGIPYAQMETRGILLPLVEAHVNYRGRAHYDDELKVTVSATPAGKASLRFDIDIVQASTGAPVTSGYTVHAVTDPTGKVTRLPDWVITALQRPTAEGTGDGKCPFCHGEKCIGACRD